MTVYIDANDPVYLAIVEYVHQHGVFPAIDDILNTTMLHSKQTVHTRLAHLCAAGLVQHLGHYKPYKLPDDVMIKILDERVKAQERLGK